MPLLHLLAQASPNNFWTGSPGSTALFAKILVTFLVTAGLLFGMSKLPAQTRRPIVATFVFLAGGFYVLYYLWPQPINRQPGDLPSGLSETVGFWLSDALGVVANFTNVIAAFLIGLGVYSVARIHLTKIVKKQQDWGFSVVLLLCVVSMTVLGYYDWYTRKIVEGGPPMDLQSNWHLANYGYNLLFDGLLQQMDAAMFSMIAFYILSAAYRAFRIRSVEATILLATALVVILSFMGAFGYFWDHSVIHGNQMFTLSEIYNWIRASVQAAAIRSIDFGVGIGSLAMGLRIWLSLERQGAN